MYPFLCHRVSFSCRRLLGKCCSPQTAVPEKAYASHDDNESRNQLDEDTVPLTTSWRRCSWALFRHMGVRFFHNSETLHPFLRQAQSGWTILLKRNTQHWHTRRSVRHAHVCLTLRYVSCAWRTLLYSGSIA